MITSHGTPQLVKKPRRLFLPWEATRRQLNLRAQSSTLELTSWLQLNRDKGARPHFADQALVNRATKASRPCGIDPFAQEQILLPAGAETKNRTFMH
jgi:hypothetical protein